METSYAVDILSVIFVALLFARVMWMRYRYPDMKFAQSNRHLFLIYCFLILMTLMVAELTADFTVYSLEKTIHYFGGMEDSSWRYVFLFPHIAGAITASFLGPALFFKQFREKYPHHHRTIGKFYVFGVLSSAVIVLPLTTTNAGGFYARIGFTTMASLWFIFTFLAYKYIRQKDYVQHRRWMIRSFAMTFAFVNVNFTFPVSGIYGFLGLEAEGVKIMQSVMSWFSNLVIAECYLAATKHSGAFVNFSRFKERLLSKERFTMSKHWQIIRK